MPKVSLSSDLHLELAAAPKLKGGDILLLAGDVWTAAHIENRGAARRRFEKIWARVSCPRQSRILWQHA